MTDENLIEFWYRLEYLTGQLVSHQVGILPGTPDETLGSRDVWMEDGDWLGLHHVVFA